MRLDKFLSENTTCTRSQLKQMIRSGKATVNGVIIKKPEYPVQETDSVALDGQSVSTTGRCCLLLFKPVGYVCATEDRTEHTVMELIPPELQVKGLFPVGRLDKDTSGLLLLTNDGAFSHALLSPKRHIPKYYHMQLARPFEDAYCAALENGISLADGTKCRPAQLWQIADTQKEALICLHEGKYHQVRRMMAALGNHVEQLRRVALGGLVLPPEMQPGDCVALSLEKQACLEQPLPQEKLNALLMDTIS